MDRSYWRTVSLVTLWQVSASICYYTVFAATPFFRDEFGLSRFGVGLVVTALTLGYAVWLLPVGAVIDRFGEGRTLVVGLVGLGVGAALVAGAPTYPLLLAAAFGLGSTYATAIPGTNKAIYDAIAAGRQNLALGIKQVGVTAGSGISALLVTGLAGALFWQAGFLIAAGSALVVAIIFAVCYRSAGEGGRAEYPDFRALSHNRPYRVLVAAGFFLGAALFTTTGYTVLYLEESIGASIAGGGVVLALVQLFGSVGRLAGGWLSDNLPGEPHVRIGAILIVQALAGALLFVVVAATATPVAAAVAFSALGFFVLGNTGVYYSYMATLVTADEMGGATAGGQLSLVAGSVVAPPAFGYLADSVGYRASWWLLAAGTALAAGLLVYAVRLEPPVDEPAMRE
ncbi:major facilitator superfamily MFS_1 [Haloterrigena turkmenica DSM 5511]|uniref:Major facilitator superfamily MFS_1 n=1 Tax=Haloterrigena turkmenica (strain ATCC 51198 / DSM 5511 / JCM 9101 / NCIMB 13204 / VKM B-1734 / 4k) TaxID=543526 RepID=D2RWK0_HALTV|nr:MFS transporter [Haloterrigena turkmenica]ADB61501.1 major facilitator superfamily MFS_1 [Haloterrigena turkmenica DSM 5511]